MAFTGKIAQHDDDVVVCSALRTPICKSRKGMLKDTYPADMLSTVFSDVLADTNLDPKLVEDICVGNVSMPGCFLATKTAQFMSDIPYTTSISTINRQCSSGLQACMNIAGGIKSGSYDIGIGAGVESMSMYAMGGQRVKGVKLNPKTFEIPLARDCLIPMGITSENVAEEFGVTRQEQDTMAVESHAKATAAQKNGHFDAEIVPVKTKLVEKDGTEKEVVISKDDGIRPTTKMETLAKLRPAFKKGGSTTAGNASQISDGAAAVLLARRSAAKKLGLPILGVLRSYATVGVPPHVMGIGPAHAIPVAVEKAGLKLDDIDIFEINETFASQVLYSVKKLGIPMNKVNPKGGAIALGHPVGATGARQIATLLHELKRTGERYGVVSMCMPTGMGAAAVFECEKSTES